MPKPKGSNLRLAVALALYLVLALVATFTLDGVLRTVMWLFFIGLALKTVSAANNDRTMD